MTASDTKIVDFPMAQAAKWAAYMHADEITTEGREEFSQWYAQCEQNRQAYQQIEKSWDALDYATISDPELDAEFETLVQKRGAPLTKIFSRKVAGAIAASLIIAIGAWTVVLQGFGQGENQHYATGIGEIKTITLADGSEITLAGATTLVTHFSELRREAELVNGQAYFDIMPDPQRQFMIRTDNTEVRVLGTEFDIQKTADDVRVSVTEGVVEIVDIQDRVDQGAGAVSSMKLVVGEQIYVSADGEHSAVTSFEPASLLAWREGRFEYSNAPLSRVIDEVNRYRRLKITLADPALANMPVTIAFSADQTENLFEGLELTGLIEVIRSADAIIIRSK